MVTPLEQRQLNATAGLHVRSLAPATGPDLGHGRWVWRQDGHPGLPSVEWYGSVWKWGMIWYIINILLIYYGIIQHDATWYKPYSGTFREHDCDKYECAWPVTWCKCVTLRHSGHLAQLSAQVLSLLLNLEVWSCAVTLSQLWNMLKLIKIIKQRTYKNWLPRVHGMCIQMKKLTFTRPWACPCLRHELGRWQQWSGIMPLGLQLMEVQMYHWMSRVETCNHPWTDGRMDG